MVGNEEDPDHDVISSDPLWKQSTLFQETDAFESSLFSPLQLDSQSRRRALTLLMSNCLQSPQSN